MENNDKEIDNIKEKDIEVKGKKKEVNTPSGIYDERVAREKNKEKRKEIAEEIKKDAKEGARKLKLFGQDYYRIVKKIFSSNSEANQVIKEIFERDPKKHFVFINALFILFALIPFINLCKSKFKVSQGLFTMAAPMNPIFPIFVFVVGLLFYLVFVSFVLFAMEQIFNKRKLKFKDLINLINIKVIVMLFYTFIILIAVIIKPVENSTGLIICSALMLISLSTSDSLMIRIGRKTGLIREINNKYMITLNTLLSVLMFFAYYTFYIFL